MSNYWKKNHYKRQNRIILQHMSTRRRVPFVFWHMYLWKNERYCVNPDHKNQPSNIDVWTKKSSFQFCGKCNFSEHEVLHFCCIFRKLDFFTVFESWTKSLIFRNAKIQQKFTYLTSEASSIVEFKFLWEKERFE